MNPGSIYRLILLSCLLGWAGCDSDKHADAREKYLACWNTFVYHHHAYVIFWNDFVNANSEVEEKECLRRCHDAVDRINPYSPIGVDPRLAEALMEMQRALKEKIEFEQQQLGQRSYGDRRHELSQAVEAADAKLKAAQNRVVADIGDIVSTDK